MSVIAVWIYGPENDFVAIGPFERQIEAIEFVMEHFSANPVMAEKSLGWYVFDDTQCDYSPDEFVTYRESIGKAKGN